MFHSFTPASFDLLVPTLKLKVDQVHVKFNNLSPYSNPTEGQEGTGPNDHNVSDLFRTLSEWSDLVCSSLILTVREVGIYSAEKDQTLLIPYGLISLHGISRTPGESQPSSIYCQLDDSLNSLMRNNQDNQLDPEHFNSETLDVDPIELILTPHDPTIVEGIFEGLSFCASLHPSKPSMADNNNDPNNPNHSQFELNDDLISALIDTDDEEKEVESSVGKVQDQRQLDPPNRYNPY